MFLESFHDSGTDLPLSPFLRPRCCAFMACGTTQIAFMAMFTASKSSIISKMTRYAAALGLGDWVQPASTDSGGGQSRHTATMPSPLSTVGLQIEMMEVTPSGNKAFLRRIPAAEVRHHFFKYPKCWASQLPTPTPCVTQHACHVVSRRKLRTQVHVRFHSKSTHLACMAHSTTFARPGRRAALRSWGAPPKHPRCPWTI